MITNYSYKIDYDDISKCVLLYSGGLDTSVLLKWLGEKYGCEVITVTLDVGQSKDPNYFKKIKEKALMLGVKKAYIIDAKKEFADNYVAKAIKANAMYEDSYPLSTAIARPLQAEWGVKIAIKEKADAIAHGCTGKGNDQVRFDGTIMTLAPFLKIIAPIRNRSMHRDDEIAYAKKHGIPVPVDVDSPYSVDENLWGRSIECGILEDPEKEPPPDAFEWTVDPKNAPDTPEYVELFFEEGIPKALNGEEMELWELIMTLNEIAGKHGVGRVDHMEDRIVGLKSREIYEVPAATVIIMAHKDLEKTVNTIHVNHMKPIIDKQWSFMAYSGLWYDPLMSALNAFIDKVNEFVTGTVRMKLYKGSAIVVGRKSDYSLYDKALATYERGQTFSQKSSPGLIDLWTLQTRMINQIQKRKKKAVIASKPSIMTE